MDLGTFVLGIAFAFLMGSALGLERQIHQHPAGLRTNALVCVGAALFVSLSRLMPCEASPSRIAAQVVSGIGFLGGGVILREGLNVRGVTTAAMLWCSAGLGTLAGAGFWVEAGVGTGIILAANMACVPSAGGSTRGSRAPRTFRQATESKWSVQINTRVRFGGSSCGTSAPNAPCFSKEYPPKIPIKKGRPRSLPIFLP